MPLVTIFLYLGAIALLISTGYGLFGKYYYNHYREADAFQALASATNWGMTGAGFLFVALFGLLFV